MLGLQSAVNPIVHSYPTGAEGLEPPLYCCELSSVV